MIIRPPAGSWGAGGSFPAASRIGCGPPAGVSVPATLLKMPRPDVPERLDQSRVLCRQFDFGGTPTTQAPSFIITVPSPRLRVKVGVLFVRDTDVLNVLPDLFTGDAWQVTPLYWVDDIKDYRPGQPVFSSALQLPSAYEIDTAAERFQVDVALTGSVNVPRGTWYATGSWEPDDVMDDSRRAQLFQQCSLQVAGTVPRLVASST